MRDLRQATGMNRWQIPPLHWVGAMPASGQRTALVACWGGHVASLSRYTIATDGTVTPSVVCPEHGCLWHEVVRLEGWTP